MKDKDKTKEQLIGELAKMRQRVAELKASETERKKVELEYRTIIRTTVDGFWLADMQGRFLDVNDAYCQLVGYSRDELLKMSIPDIEAIEKPEETAARIAKIRKVGKDRFETYHRCKDGRIVDVEVSVNYIEVDEGRMFVFIRDITECKQAEEALLESEERYRSLVNLGGKVGEAIVMLQDTEQGDAIQTFVSKEWPRITGYPEKELLGMSFFDLLSPKYHEAALERHKRRMRGEAIPELFELSIIRKDGTEVPIEATSAYTRYKGEYANVVFVRDITERKRAEEALMESEGRFRSIVENSHDGILILDEAYRFIYGNDELCGMSGYSLEEIIGQDFRKFLDEESKQLVADRYIRRQRGEELPRRYEFNFIRKDGEKRRVEISATVIKDSAGKVKTVAQLLDITERKQAEEKEKRLQQELYLSSRLAAIGQLSAGVAHEINNPLTGILGYSELLLRKPTDENTTKGLEIIHNAAQRMAKIVENLTTFARRHQPKKEYVDINEIIKEALELRAYELKTGNIEVALDLAPDLPQTMSDFYQIQEVFLNLILNAEQAMTEAHRGGKLIIKTKQLKNRVIVSFADDGPGIPSEILNKLFDPFFSTRGEKGGTGLGLSICHGIVTEHGGKIYARSKPGKGATFFVELPVTT